MVTLEAKVARCAFFYQLQVILAFGEDIGTVINALVVETEVFFVVFPVTMIFVISSYLGL